MDIAELPIPDSLKSVYYAKGIHALYPPQVECVKKGLFEGKNLLVAIPTASGKTLIAEMVMHQHAERGGKCLYIVPLKALASEKYDEFRDRGLHIGIATGDFDRRDEFLGRNDIIVATSEKIDSLLRNRAPWITAITLLVVDEVHLIDDPGRGATLEMIITRLRAVIPDLQVISLSATIGNPQSLAGWLEAEAVTSSWRPIDLREGVFLNGEIRFKDGTRRVEGITRFDDTNLCLDTIAEGGQCLVFVSSRKNAEAFAKRMASSLKRESPELAALAERIGSEPAGTPASTLASCIAKGAAFHHAGLRRGERSVVEEGFRNGNILCIASTPTLAAGLNLPARRVIIRDYLRFSAGEGMVPIPVREYRQMAGRAGRPGLDPYGEAILIAKDPGGPDELFEAYIEAPAENVNSQCAAESVLRSHVLALVASGFTRSEEEILKFLQKTYYGYHHRSGRVITGIVRRCIHMLTAEEMILSGDGSLSVTEYGSLVSQLYLDPAGAARIVESLRSAVDWSDLGLLHAICSTPDMFTLYIGTRDLPYLERVLAERGEEIWLPVPCGEEEESYFRGLKTAMVIAEWTEEVPEALVCEHFSTGPGDLYALVESMNWLLHGTVRLCGMFRPQFLPMARDLETGVKYGVKPELIPLVRIPGIGRVRARRLFNNGITTPEEVASAGLGKLSPLLGQGVAEQVLLALREKQGKRKKDRDPGEAVRERRGGRGEKQETGRKKPTDKELGKNTERMQLRQPTLSDFGEPHDR